jgi:hypothetical protein
MATWKAPFLKGRISPVLFLVPSGKTHIFICTQMYTPFTKQSSCYKVSALHLISQTTCILYIHIYTYIYILKLYVISQFVIYIDKYLLYLFVTLFISLHQVTKQDKYYAQFLIGHTTAVWCSIFHYSHPHNLICSPYISGLIVHQYL